jgi:hypothetical protein
MAHGPWIHAWIGRLNPIAARRDSDTDTDEQAESNRIGTVIEGNSAPPSRLRRPPASGGPQVAEVGVSVLSLSQLVSDGGHGRSGVGLRLPGHGWRVEQVTTGSEGSQPIRFVKGAASD